MLSCSENCFFFSGYDGSWCEDYGGTYGPSHEWNYPGSVFFSVTVITSIGILLKVSEYEQETP